MKSRPSARAGIGKNNPGTSRKGLTPAYMKSKSIQPHSGTFTDAEGKKTYIPAFDVDEKQRTTQYIQADGAKRFARDPRKEGCFHIVGRNLAAKLWNTK